MDYMLLGAIIISSVLAFQIYGRYRNHRTLIIFEKNIHKTDRLLAAAIQ
jgi:hypothetical protein